MGVRYRYKGYQTIDEDRDRKQNNEFKKQTERLDAHQRQIDQFIKMSFQTEHVNVVQLKKDILEQINSVFDR